MTRLHSASTTISALLARSGSALVKANSLSFKLIGYKNNSKAFSDIYFEVHTMSTQGDKILDVALAKLSVLPKNWNGMLSHEIDFAVHSLKDLPTQLPERLVLAAARTGKSS